jgi:hypothetical protein
MKTIPSHLNAETSLFHQGARVAIISFLIVSLCSGCRKKKDDTSKQKAEPDTEQATAADVNLAESFAADIEAICSQASESGSLETYRTNGTAVVSTNVLTVSPCATVTTMAASRTFVVDFGSGCTGLDGRVRSGQVSFDFSASAPGAMFYRNPGYSVKINAVNYMVDGYIVFIHDKVIVNTTATNLPPDMNPGTNLTWSITGMVGFNKPNGPGTSLTYNRTKELMNTADTNCYKGQSRHIRWSKAIVKINGAASGVNVKGESCTSAANNLVRDFNCTPFSLQPHRSPFISGTLSYKPGGRLERLIDFGSGVCDKEAALTINGTTYPFSL